MKNIAYLGLDIQFARISEEDYKRGLYPLYEYDVEFTDLTAFEGIIITNHVDEDYLVEHKQQLEDYLNQGGVIFSLTEISEPFIPNIGIWKRSPIPLKDREVRIINTEYPLFKNIEKEHLEARKGVRGFFSRGYFETIPAHAEILVTDQNDDVMFYVDRESTKGTIFAGAGTDLYRLYVNENNTATKVSQNMLDVIRLEAARVRGEQV